jgi:phosphoglycolate phosphatase
VSWAAVLFDLDGTLTDSGPGIINAVTYAVGALGAQPLTAAAVRAFIGPPLRESFAAVGIDPAAGILRYREYYLDQGLFENSVYPGVPELLAATAATGARIAVATSKPTVYAVRILEHFGLLTAFDHVQGDELDGSRRHKHQVIAAALAELRVEAAGAVMVGDRAADAVGAAQCATAFVGAGWGYGEPGELEAAGATAVAATPGDLLPLLSAELRPRRPPG